jgi:predicted GNAT family acetyltransferase
MNDKEHAKLYNPAWAALHGPHSRYADRTELACAYKEEYFRFGALSENTEKAFRELASIVQPGRIVAIMGTDQTIDYPEWNHIASRKAHIMILEEPVEAPDFPYEKLSSRDVPEMIALSEISPHTGDLNLPRIEIGDFYGIKEDGHVVAMAGERLQLDEYTEVSGVCTHPDYRKRGLGGGLTYLKCKQVQERGKIPFLGVFEENVGAVRLYEKLDFKIFLTGVLEILQRTDH